MKKQYLLVIAVAIILISGCNKKIVSPSDGDTIIPPTTKVISNSKWDESFISVDTTNYTFTFSENPNLQVGDIMVSSKDGGYLRRLTNIKQNGNNTVYETEFASISEAIEDTKTTFETDLVVDNNKLKSAFLAKGVTIDKQSLKNSNNTNLNLNINIVLYDKDGNTNTTGDQIKLKGSYGTSTSLKTDIEIHNFNLKKLALTYTMTKQESLKATCGISSVVEKRIAKIPFGDFVIPAGIPITVSPVLEIYAGVTVNFNAGTEVSEEISETINCTTLVQYLNGEWSTDKTVDKVFNYNPPSFNSNVSLVGYIKPVLKFKIYRVLSPKVNSKLYAELDAYERAVNWELYAGFQAGVGIDMKIWKKDIFDFNLNIIDVKDLLANGTIGNHAPVANFTATPTSGSAPLTVNFTDQSTNTPTSWQWDFGDGNTSTVKNPTHTYNNAGSYTVLLTVTNSNGSDTKNQNDYITVSNGGSGTGTFTDPRDGQTYKTVVIGSQTWFAENLNYQTTNSWWYDNSSANGDIYGRLYTWSAALTACPGGWHLPSDAEWTTLTDFLGGLDVAGGKMKETGLDHWNSPNTGATNESGFTGLPGGYRHFNGEGYLDMGDYGLFWSSSVEISSYAWLRRLYYISPNVHRDFRSVREGMSIRCLRD